ncbi:MAG: hypothetical protein ACD_4C00444G0001 [uncultured bacterium (gcode 4)]|uniref:Uncharacterized protein n=1 Tax=uncultured bacterium (gcode 4) TaxID=1234023 RepID=K2FT74_9BACT|nr:MAG: hypothetical protein ACD_4C00444G0001 [uncultured bacterium (gcode 4)]
MWIRGAALKRAFTSHNLLWLSNNSWVANFWISLISGSLNMKKYTWTSYVWIGNSIFPWENIDPFKFYTIEWTFYVDNTRPSNLTLKWNWINISSKSTQNLNYLDNRYLIIWSNADNLNQWNDIIDYVKIYKN